MTKKANIVQEEFYNEITRYSQEKLELLRDKMKRSFSDTKYMSICVYACGSLGRLEMTENSDLDLFFIKKSKGKRAGELNKNLNKYEFFGRMNRINLDLGFENPSKGGEYWVFTEEENLLDIGSRYEDFNNSFTARLLMLLESKPILNDKYYDTLVNRIVDSYFEDYEEHKDSFYPLYLMNDILRYWYTLTLNYEYRRDSKDTPEKKNWKRLKLKYARLLTCFSMIACLYRDNISKEYVVECIKQTPIERLKRLADNYPNTRGTVDSIIEAYRLFLEMRKSMNNDFSNEKVREEAFVKADEFHHLVVKELMQKVSNHNLSFKERVDVY